MEPTHAPTKAHQAVLDSALALADELNRLTATVEEFTQGSGEMLIASASQIHDPAYSSDAEKLDAWVESLFESVNALNAEVCDFCGVLEDQGARRKS